MDIKEHTVKFTQMWDVITAKQAEYERYVSEKYYPLMEAAGIHVADGIPVRIDLIAL